MTAKKALKEIKKQVGNIHIHDFSSGLPVQTNLKLRDSEYFKIVETALNRLEELEKVLLDPRVLESVCLAEANIGTVLEKYKEIDVYQEVLKETIEDLGKIRFLIKQLKEGCLK